MCEYFNPVRWQHKLHMSSPVQVHWVLWAIIHHPASHGNSIWVCLGSKPKKISPSAEFCSLHNIQWERWPRRHQGTNMPQSNELLQPRATSCILHNTKRKICWSMKNLKHWGNGSGCREICKNLRGGQTKPAKEIPSNPIAYTEKHAMVLSPFT